MEFTDENNFAKEFFKRTMYNLNLYEHHNEICKEVFQYEVTQLVNSLLGLVVFVKEEGVAFSSIQLSEIKSESSISWNYCDRDGGGLEVKNFKNFLRHIRNAIAHKRLTIKSNDQKEISSIIFNDKDRNNKFEVELTIDEVKNIVSKLSQCIEQN